MEQALTARLLASAALVALVGNRITWDERPQVSDMPAVVLQVIDGAPLYSDEGHSGLTEKRVQIDCWAKTADAVNGSSQAKLVADAVMAALPVSLTQDGLEMQGVFPEDIRDFEPVIGPGEVKLFRRSLDYLINYSG